ncbi:TPA: DEAD/DEAH box helicase, partial [Salmonella enterica subsp. enterica serovar Java]
SGKSFIIKKFIFDRIQKNKSKFFVYVVPSKALINQVSNELSKELKESALVLTTYRELECFDKNIVYVLTPVTMHEITARAKRLFSFISFLR